MTNDDEPVRLVDLALRVCEAFGWPLQQVTHEMPIHRFWACLDYIRRRDYERAKAVQANPLAALALRNGRGGGD